MENKDLNFNSQEELTEFLQSNCSSKEERNYDKPLTEDELDARRRKLVIKDTEIIDAQNEAKESARSYKERVDGLKSEQATLLQTIKTKKERTFGRIYKLVDYTAGMVLSYNSDGQFIESRLAEPDELQRSIFDQIPAKNLQDRINDAIKKQGIEDTQVTIDKAI